MSSVPTAKVYGGLPPTEGGSMSAEQAGLRARQHGSANSDVPMGGTGQLNQHVGRTEGASMTMTAEAEENTRVANMRRKIIEIASDGQAPNFNPFPIRPGMMGLGDLMEGMQMPQQDAFVDPNDMYQPQQPQHQQPQQAAPRGQWQIAEMSAQTKSGKTVLIWQVRDGQSGITLPHQFRLGETASRVVAVLNHTGNINDARVGHWIGMDKQRMTLLSKQRQLKEAVTAGNGSAKAQLMQVREALAELDLKIGI